MIDFSGKTKEEIEAIIADAQAAIADKEKAEKAARESEHAKAIIAHRQAIRAAVVWLQQNDEDLPKTWKEMDLKSLPRVTASLKERSGVAVDAVASEPEEPAPAPKATARGRRKAS